LRFISVLPYTFALYCGTLIPIAANKLFKGENEMTNAIISSSRIEQCKYLLTTKAVSCLVYRSEGLWWAKDFNGAIVDSAPTKAQLYRAIESIEVAA
jgi:hypothetical protein